LEAAKIAFESLLSKVQDLSVWFSYQFVFLLFEPKFANSMACLSERLSDLIVISQKEKQIVISQKEKVLQRNEAK